MKRISKFRAPDQDEIIIPSNKFNRKIGKYTNKRFTTEGEIFEGASKEWKEYINSTIPLQKIKIN